MLRCFSSAVFINTIIHYYTYIYVLYMFVDDQYASLHFTGVLSGLGLVDRLWPGEHGPEARAGYLGQYFAQTEVNYIHRLVRMQMNLLHFYIPGLSTELGIYEKKDFKKKRKKTRFRQRKKKKKKEKKKRLRPRKK